MLKRVAGRALLFALVVAVLAFHANGQEGPIASRRQFQRAEVFVGFSYANLSLGSQSSVFAPVDRNYFGTQLAAKLNVRKSIGLRFDFGGQSGESTIPDPLGYETHMQLETTHFLAGPEFTLRTRKFNTFAHTLLGLTHTSLNQLNQSLNYCLYRAICDQPIIHRTNLALSAGGGIDRNWKKHFAIRLFEADYIPTRLSGKWKSHFRVGTGLMLKF
jgi:hypothetical protein